MIRNYKQINRCREIASARLIFEMFLMKYDHIGDENYTKTRKT